MKSLFRLLPLLLALLALTAAGCRSSAASRENSGAAGAAEKETAGPAVAVLKLGANEAVPAITASGTALPLRDSLLGSEVNGKITQIVVARGQAVKRGQILMRLNPEAFQLGVEQAQSAYDAAAIAADQLQRDYERYETLRRDESISEAAFEAVRLQQQQALARRTMAAAALKSAKKSLGDSILTAPYDGVVTQILKEVGETVTLMPPTPLLRLVDLSALEVQIFLPENDGRFMFPDQEATVRVESIGLETTGRVVFVSSQLQPGTQSFEVRLRIENPENRIRAGSFVSVTIPRRLPDGAVLVPATAIGQEPNGRSFVVVEEDDEFVKTPVTPGIVIGDRVLIEEGLPRDATIAATAAALDQPVNGKAVRP